MNLNILLEIDIISLRYRYFFSDTNIDTDTQNIDTSIDTSGIGNSPAWAHGGGDRNRSGKGLEVREYDFKGCTFQEIVTAG